MQTLEDLGFDVSFQEAFAAYRKTNDGDFSVARVAIEHKVFKSLEDLCKEVVFF